MAELKPNTQYHWSHDDKFEMNGKEFETIFNTVKAVLATPESQKVLALQRAHDAMQDVFVKAIDKGIVKEGAPEEEGPIEVPLSKKETKLTSKKGGAK